MKKAKILLLPLSALLLAGCTFNDAKSWFGKNVYFPVRNFIEWVITVDGKTDDSEKKEDTDPQPEEGETWTVVSAESVYEADTNRAAAPYKHVAVDMQYIQREGDPEDEQPVYISNEEHSIYNLNSETNLWELVAEESSEGAYEELYESDYLLNPEDIQNYAEEGEEEDTTVVFKKSSLGRFSIEWERTSIVEVKMHRYEIGDTYEEVQTKHIVLNKYFYFDERTVSYVSDGSLSAFEAKTFTWSE